MLFDLIFHQNLRFVICSNVISSKREMNKTFCNINTVVKVEMWDRGSIISCVCPSQSGFVLWALTP